jgi:hypothetical protein
MALSEYESRVLAELELDLQQSAAQRSAKRRRVITRVLVSLLGVVVPGGLAFLAVRGLTAGAAAAVIGVIGVLTGSLAWCPARWPRLPRQVRRLWHLVCPAPLSDGNE